VNLNKYVLPLETDLYTILGYFLSLFSVFIFLSFFIEREPASERQICRSRYLLYFGIFPYLAGAILLIDLNLLYPQIIFNFQHYLEPCSVISGISLELLTENYQDDFDKDKFSFLIDLMYLN